MLLVRSRSNYRVQALPSIKADRSWNLSRIASVHISFSSSLHTRYVLATLSLTPLSIIALFFVFFFFSFSFLSFSSSLFSSLFVLLIWMNVRSGDMRFMTSRTMMADQRFTLKQLYRCIFDTKKLHCHVEEILISWNELLYSVA